MIKSEGIKAFRGRATIRPKVDTFQPFEVSGDWVYKPDTGCWYCHGSSYMSSIVTDIREETDDLIEEIGRRINAIKCLVVGEENKGEIEEAIKSTEEWIDGVKKRMVVSK